MPWVQFEALEWDQCMESVYSFKNVELEMSYKSKEQISRHKDIMFHLENFL